MSRRVTFRAVRELRSARARRREWVDDFPVALVYRPMSWVVTPWVVRLGVPPLAITLLNLCVALVLPWAAAFGGGWWVCGLGVWFHVFDCVDGDVARATGRASRLGGLVDGWTDVVCWAALLASAGIVAERAGVEWGVEVGLAAAVVWLLKRLLSALAVEFAPAVAEEEEEVGAWSWGEVAQMLTFGWEHVWAVAVGVGGWLGREREVLVGIAGYAVVVCLGNVVWVLGRAGGWDQEGVGEVSQRQPQDQAAGRRRRRDARPGRRGDVFERQPQD